MFYDPSPQYLRETYRYTTLVFGCRDVEAAEDNILEFNRRAKPLSDLPNNYERDFRVQVDIDVTYVETVVRPATANTERSVRLWISSLLNSHGSPKYLRRPPYSLRRTPVGCKQDHVLTGKHLGSIGASGLCLR
jgi:hypothetical protein